jgi:LysR family transcriptional regulator, transcriptional activator of the cysJI operon
MQIDSLKVLCDLAETQNFTRAAQINHVTQSAVSQTLTTLEKHYRVLLVERSKKNFRLTPEGQAVYDYSKRILQSYEAILSKMQELKNEISGQIHIATIYSIGLYDLPPHIKRFLKEHPLVNLRVEYRHENQVNQDVIGNIVDLGLVAYPSRDPRLEVVQWQEDPLVLICHPQNPLAGSKRVKLKALQGQKFISFERDTPTRKALDKILKDQKVVVEHVKEFDNIETLKRTVELDIGIAIVPEETVRQEAAKGTLTAVQLEGDLRRELGVIYKKDKVLSPAMKAFIEMLKG